MKQLNVGDKITEWDYGSIIRFLTITRVTGKRAYALSENKAYETQFNREYDVRIKSIGNGYNSRSYRITTQDDLDKAELRILRNDCRNVNYSALTADQCRRILEIAAEK